jgi:NitT/TauT family transport system substrate-binding protein
MQNIKKKLVIVLLQWILLLFFLPGFLMATEFRVGTWKTAQTIQPFFYSRFLPPAIKSEVYSFTNPSDQKVALLAGSLDMCGTTIAHAIHSASRGQPVVLVAALCNKCSALVVRKGGEINTVKDLKAKRIGYVPGTMHEILLRDPPPITSRFLETPSLLAFTEFGVQDVSSWKDPQCDQTLRRKCIQVPWRPL